MTLHVGASFRPPPRVIARVRKRLTSLLRRQISISIPYHAAGRGERGSCHLGNTRGTLCTLGREGGREEGRKEGRKEGREGRGGGLRNPVLHEQKRPRVRSSDRRCPFSISFALSLSPFLRFLALFLSLSPPLSLSLSVYLAPFLFLLFPPCIFPLSRLRGRRRAGGRE